MFFLTTLALGTLSCQTLPSMDDGAHEPQPQIQEGHWEAKVRIKNTKTNFSYVVRMDAYAKYNEKMRLDITHILTGHLASLALRGEEMEALVVPQKVFYSGKIPPKALKLIIRVPIHPKTFYNLLFARPIVGKGWTCSENSQQQLSECYNSLSKIKVLWKSKKGFPPYIKNILVQHPAGSLKIHIARFASQLPPRKNLFYLKKPESFKLRQF